MKQFIQLIGAAILGSVVTVALFEVVPQKSATTQIQEPLPLAQVAYRATTNDGMPLDFTGAAEKVMPAVVAIKSTGKQRESQIQQLPFDSELFEQFFGPRNFQKPGESIPSQSSGSGVLISADGYIVTNNHVVKSADLVEVTLTDNRTFQAEIIGTDPDTDLAVLKIKGDNLPFLAFEDSDKAKIGEWVLAVGNPFNLNSTVTAGIISAKGRSIDILRNNKPEGNTAIESFIQTDAAINPGNSGGALVNLQGNLIGINTAIASPTGSYSGYGFAVPANLVSKVTQDIIKHGVVQRGWLGVTISSVNEELMKQNDLEVQEGAFVAGFAESSTAKEAGVREKDVITKIDGVKIPSSPALTAYIGTKRPGDKVVLTVNRQGKNLEIPVVLKGKSASEVKVKAGIASLGIELEEADPKVLKKLDLTSGVMVKSISEGKISRDTEIQEGFIITKINDKPVKSVKEVTDILKSKNSGELVILSGTYEKFPKEFNHAFRM